MPASPSPTLLAQDRTARILERLGEIDARPPRTVDDPRRLLEDSEEMARLLFELYGARAPSVAAAVARGQPGQIFPRHVLMVVERMERQRQRRTG